MMSSRGAVVARVAASKRAPAAMLAMLVVVFMSYMATGQRISTVDVGRSTYYISSQSPYNAPLNWHLAYQYCRTIGMELLTEDTQEQGEILRNFLSENGYKDQSFWTSGNQLGSSQWLWMTSGLPYNSSFSYWAAESDRSRSSSENQCMLLKAGEWSPAPCTQPHHFVCHLTRCFFFNYVRSNARSDSSSSRASVLAPGVRSVNNTATNNTNRAFTTQPPSTHRRTRRPISANRVIHFPTIVPVVQTQNTTESPSSASKNLKTSSLQKNTSAQVIEDVRQELGENSTSLSSQAPAEDESETKKDAPTQDDLDELLRLTAESNVISAGPTLSNLLQPPDLQAHEDNTTGSNNRDRTTTLRSTSDTRTRVHQLERKEVFSWALLPDTP